MDLIINGSTYDVGFAALSRSFRVDEKYRVTTEDGNVAREVRAVYADFTLSLLSVEQGEYDRLVRDIAAARGAVAVTVRDSLKGSTAYVGVFDGVEDAVLIENDEGVFWDSLNLSFTGTVPLEGGT